MSKFQNIKSQLTYIWILIWNGYEIKDSNKGESVKTDKTNLPLPQRRRLCMSGRRALYKHVTCRCYKFGHQVMSLALSYCLGLPYWHYQLVLSWYLHQPESHQLSLQKVLLVSDNWSIGPIKNCTRGSQKAQPKSSTLPKLEIFVNQFGKVFRRL